MILLPVFGHTAAEHGFEIRQVGDVYNSIDAVDKGRERIIGSIAMAEQDDKMFAALRGRFTYQLLKNWIVVERCAFEVFMCTLYLRSTNCGVMSFWYCSWSTQRSAVFSLPSKAIELGSWSIT
jgi:hypothetical protein